MEKSLPPLPEMTRSKKPPPLPLSERPLITTNRIQDPNEQVQRLHKENERLRRLLARLQSEQDSSIRRIAELEAQNHQYYEQSESQRQLVVRIANTISDAFHDYGESLQPPPSRGSSYPPQSTRTEEAGIGYEDVLSAWSDSASS
ncbi:hypothetical protein HD806DRAFT_536090 [Xylariaceae sp. AK1471]|nr:hypothetical protein HD806DRAFT_536090 [Xylariaceae sp. AK1471]